MSQAPAHEVAPVAVVTGAASGIGLATAVELIGRGYRVAMLDRDGDTVRARADDLSGPAAAARPYQVDVTAFADVVRAVDDAAAAWGRVDAVAACAGVEVLGDVIALGLDDWQRALDINLGGVFHLAKAAMPYLLDTGGAFVAVASDAGVTGAQGYSAYAASKHGVVGLVRCLALDYGPRGVRSNVVCPAFVQTPMADRIFADSPGGERDYYQAAVPLGRFAAPSEIARAITHLLSDEASYTNGMIYNIDGGSTAGYFRAAETTTTGASVSQRTPTP